MTDPLVTVEDLQVHYPVREGLLRREVGRVRAVDGVSLTVERGEAFGVVGESGSGKTTTAHAILGLESPTGGEVRFDGQPVSGMDGDAERAFRRRAQLIVQDPNEAFNPRLTVGEAVAEPLAIFGMDDAERRRAIVADIVERVGLSPDDLDRYPHEFSGGEKQRLAIARALVLNPDLLVADEPTSTLDGRVQAAVLDLLADVRREFDLSVLFVSHDIEVVRRFCDRVGVMYLGELVERGPVGSVLDDPAHPYTQVLVGSVPSLDPSEQRFERPLTDAIPDPADPPSGCRFHTRCPALIPPADVDLPAEQWRRVAAFRETVRAGELPADLTPTEADAATVREAFDLPAELPDATVEAAVTTAVERLRAGERDAAGEGLTAALPTVCERETPASVEVDGRSVACHRYDPDMAASPPE